MHRPTRFTLAAVLLGFAFGGFLDGIVLHQVLQWHHLLSGLDDPRLADLRVQVLADGLFHAALYVTGLAGLLVLLRPAPARPPVGTVRAGLAFTGWFLLGSALWHGVDALVSHALLGLHRIRMDVPDPLAWDLGWLAVFGVVPALLGAWMVRHARGGDAGGDGRVARPDRGRVEVPARPAAAGLRRARHRRVPVLVAAVTAVAGLVAAFPATGGGDAVLLRQPWVAPGRVMAAIAASDARLVWVDRGASVFVIRPGDGGQGDPPGWRDGVLRLGAGGWAAGCAGWLR